MIPVLFKANAVDFSTYGIGVLADCISCEVTEERNGAYELVLQYPVTGRNYGELSSERIIKAKPNDTADDQAFRIYRITTPIDGVVTVYAQHISYDLSNIAALTWSSESISPALAMQRVFQNTATAHSFTCQTDYSEAKPFSVIKPQSIRSCLGGVAGSFLDLWGGEYEWDNFHVIHHQGRGQHTSVVIEYGKNLTELEHDSDITEVYTDLLPYAVISAEDGSETVVTLTEVLLPIADTTLSQRKTLIRDFTDSFGEEEAITEDALRTKAQTYLANNPLGVEVPALTVSFEPLWKQPEYAAVLERVSLCDTVTIRHSALGITAKAKVITTVYDTLAEKYVSVTLGSGKANLLNNVSDAKAGAEEAAEKAGRFPALMNSAIQNATDRITGQTGGYVVLHTDSESGLPYELLILDQPSIEDAVNVWRWNVEGLGFSGSGYNGPYETAITADGQIVADFITSGSLIANIIKAGVIQSQDGSSWWDLESGEVMFSAYATTDSLEEVSGRVSQFQQSIDGLNSYVADLTESVEDVTGELTEEQENLRLIEGQMSQLQQSVDGLSLTMQEQYSGGINFVRNSAGLNGLSDDWTYAGTITAQQGAETKNSTVSNSCFQLAAYSTLTQVVDSIVPGQAYRLTVKAKKTSTYNAYVRAVINGDTEIDLFNTSVSFEWTEYTALLPDVQDSVITIKIYSRDASLFVSDIMLTEGASLHKWTPAPNEIYTSEVKIDRRGIEVSNADSAQRTVINNTEFSGYYNEEKIFSLNKDETITKKTTVDGELTVGKTKFVPMATASEGLNIVILD